LKPAFPHFRVCLLVLCGLLAGALLWRSHPGDLSGNELAQALKKPGYGITRRAGSQMRLTTQEHGEHHITIPRHDPLRVGTLSAILTEV